MLIMGAVTPFLATRTGEYAIDKDLAALDREDAIAEEKQRYIDKRTAELHERRMANVSDEDLIIALEYLTTVPASVARMKQWIYSNDEFCAAAMQGAISAAIRLDSASIAMTEAKALFDASASAERH
jgi:hypothetical protein